MDYEKTVIGLIVNSGNARSKAMESIQFAKNEEFVKAKETLQQASDELGEAHKVQTDLIQQEAGGTKHDVTLLMVHAQDHLMNAMTLKDLAEEMIDLHEKLHKNLVK
ncbi:PTS system cellobiose-specific IIA component [Salibacterium salarium]|uniref:PTS lactose/cellobiose transporter subunit IIA n=1 Tax=Salibacterium salarium TaxID=284579 RepID=UPI00278B808D|nr:PTS lactose/cellobiose transporter subunit IIA [Salibacterium salarium]MDQ0297918.1 PTS system cellobiose-specific IIA component [Salibacterium salarium]